MCGCKCRWQHAPACGVHGILHRRRTRGDSSSLGRSHLARRGCALHHIWRTPVSSKDNASRNWEAFMHAGLL